MTGVIALLNQAPLQGVVPMSVQPKKQAPGYYLRFRGQTTGPYSLQQVKDAITQGSVSRLHDVSRDQVQWFPIHTHPAILDAAQQQAQAKQSAAGPQLNTGASEQHNDVLDDVLNTPQTQAGGNTSPDSETEDLIDSILKEPHK